MTNKLVFAYSSEREDDDLIEDVKDFLDAVAEGEWEVLCWFGQDMTVLVNAPIECRTLHMEPALEMSFIPLSAALMEMDDKDNEWIEPAKTDDNSPQGIAQETTQRWFSSMFDDDGVEPAEKMTVVTPEPEPETSSRRRTGKGRKKATPSEKPAEKKRRSSGPPPSEDDEARDEPDPERDRERRKEEASTEDRSDANSLMAKFGLQGVLNGSEAMKEMFVWDDKKDD